MKPEHIHAPKSRTVIDSLIATPLVLLFAVIWIAGVLLVGVPVILWRRIRGKPVELPEFPAIRPGRA